MRDCASAIGENRVPFAQRRVEFQARKAKAARLWHQRTIRPKNTPMKPLVFRLQRAMRWSRQSAHWRSPPRALARPANWAVSAGSDRKSVEWGKSVAVGVDSGGRLIIKKKKK